MGRGKLWRMDVGWSLICKKILLVLGLAVTGGFGIYLLYLGSFALLWVRMLCRGVVHCESVWQHVDVGTAMQPHVHMQR